MNHDLQYLKSPGFIVPLLFLTISVVTSIVGLIRIVFYGAPWETPLIIAAIFGCLFSISWLIADKLEDRASRNGNHN